MGFAAVETVAPEARAAGKIRKRSVPSPFHERHCTTNKGITNSDAMRSAISNFGFRIFGVSSARSHPINVMRDSARHSSFLIPNCPIHRLLPSDIIEGSEVAHGRGLFVRHLCDRARRSIVDRPIQVCEHDGAPDRAAERSVRRELSAAEYSDIPGDGPGPGGENGG